MRRQEEDEVALSDNKLDGEAAVIKAGTAGQHTTKNGAK